MDKIKIKTSEIIIGIIGLLIIVPVLGAWSIIQAGNVGVVTRLGAVNRVVTPGFIIKIPLIEYVHMMETRTQKEQADASSASKDLQEVKATIALNYHLRGEKAVEVYQNIGTDYKIRVIDPAMQEAFKATTAKFTAAELIGKREAVKQEALVELKARLNSYNVIVDNFNIINFDFSTEFNQAIEQKQVAQQNLERARLEAQTAIAQAEGQAQAQKALRDTGSLSPEYLEFLALQKWNGVLPTVTGNGTPFINIPIK
jgi:regulator of protease activity HflC (stomatin/prohibitin superfamily)